MSVDLSQLHGVAKALFVTLACLAIENSRSDARLHDPCAAAVFTQIAGVEETLRLFGVLI